MTTKSRVCLLLTFAAIAPAAVPRIERIDDHLYRGKQPKDEDFAQLARMGIKTVLDLRGGIFHTPWERKRVEAAGMQYTSVRLSGFFPPGDGKIAQILAILEDPARGPVFVHCKRGGDRAGIVIACYRMSHDHWTNAHAYQEALKDGLSPFEVLMRRYLRRFDPSALRRAANGQATCGNLEPDASDSCGTVPLLPLRANRHQ